ncbi:hypothetical protein TELCIR_10876, partial [Teladorsagia circumcincta]
VYSNNNSEIGMITKLFGGTLKECLTDADTFQVTFPGDMSVNAKLIMMSASILIDDRQTEIGTDRIKITKKARMKKGTIGKCPYKYKEQERYGS